MKSLLLLGSTGSIGTQTLALVRESKERFRVTGLCADRSWELLLEQVHEFHPRVVALADPGAAEALRKQLPTDVALIVGPEAALELAATAEYDLAVHGIVGAAGVLPSEAVLKRGRTLALANKESLVVAGAELMELSRSNNAPILPVDSEHAAIFQCLRGERLDRVRTIYLTASGGPFRDLPLDAFKDVTPDRALEHPNWDMGARITIGSATLMNKALEVIETHHLYGVEPERIKVVLHRQSIVHSLVEFVDGSVMAQLGPPDMRGPIHFALNHPDREPANLRGFDMDLFRSLTFEDVNAERFPALELGYRCLEEGGDAGATLNAADEVAVDAFLNGRIGFQEIVDINRTVLGRRPGLDGSVSELLRADAFARELALKETEATRSPSRI